MLCWCRIFLSSAPSTKFQVVELPIPKCAKILPSPAIYLPPFLLFPFLLLYCSNYHSIRAFVFRICTYGMYLHLYSYHQFKSFSIRYFSYECNCASFDAAVLKQWERVFLNITYSHIYVMLVFVSQFSGIRLVFVLFLLEELWILSYSPSPFHFFYRCVKMLIRNEK